MKRLLILISCLGVGGCITLPPYHPYVPPPPPPTVNVACIVYTPDAQPIANALCIIAGQTGPTNNDGYHLFIGVPKGTQTWEVRADGYELYVAQYDIIASANFPITLTPSTPPFPSFTKAQRMAVKCDIAYTEQSGQNSPNQTYAYAGWNVEERAKRRELWKRIGMTHVPINFALNYPNSGVAPFDFRSDPSAFVTRLLELKQDGFIVFLSAAQAETYGRYPLSAPILADIGRWKEWGWDVVDGSWPGWESDDFLSAQVHLDILRALRATLGPEKVIGIQPGRVPNEGLIYVGGQGYGPIEFWRALHAPDINIDALFFEPPAEAFNGEKWRQQLYDAFMGASARIYRRINPIPSVFPVPPYDSTGPFIENWTRSAPYAGGGTPLVYWEGPAFLRWMSLTRRWTAMSDEHMQALEAQEWSSQRKREAMAVARLVPGFIGGCDGL